MKPFNDLIEKLKQELVELSGKQGNLKDKRVIQKSQELDEFLNSFYELLYCTTKQNRTTRTYKTIAEAVVAALSKKGLTGNGRILRLKELCRRVGEKINLSPLQLSNLDLLAQAHNLGKVVIPNRLLFKEGPLAEKDRQTIRQHPEKGRIALFSEELSGLAGLILKHHERWDGSGYPLGLKKTEIPVECRILAVADAYDAMTSDRPYSKAMRKEKALKELERCAGSQFDPELVEALSEVVEGRPEE